MPGPNLVEDYRELVPHPFNSFSTTTLHEYVPYKSIRWRCVALHAQAQNLRPNLYIKKILCTNFCNIRGKFCSDFRSILRKTSEIWKNEIILRKFSKHCRETYLSSILNKILTVLSGNLFETNFEENLRKNVE